MSDAPVLPIVELITQNIVDALLGVRTDLAFQTTITQVTRAQRDMDPLADNGVVLTEEDDEPQESDADVADHADERIQPYAIVVVVFEPASSEYPPRRRLEVLRADITKALMADYQRGGYASDTSVGRRVWVDPDLYGGLDAMAIEVRVRYATDVNDPYVLRTSAGNAL
jgi:hypothetical protein